MPDDSPSELLDDAAARLYGLAPAEFTATRDELAASARRAGDADAAKLIKALHRPSAAAWLVNALIREQSPAVSELLAFGDEARAHGGGDAADFSRRRRALLREMLRRARKLAADAGESAADATLRDVESTFDAAITDEGAAGAVRTGRLQRALRSGGFDAVDVDGAVGGAPSAPATAGRPKLTVITGGRAQEGGPPRTRGSSPASAARGAGPSREEAAAAAALADLDAADEAAKHARDAADAVQHEIEALRARRAELERELASAQDAQSAAQHRAAAARRLSVAAERKLAAAQRKASQAQQRLSAAAQREDDDTERD